MTNPFKIGKDVYISLNQFALMLKVSRQAVCDWAASGILDSVSASDECEDGRSYVMLDFAEYARDNLKDWQGRHIGMCYRIVDLINAFCKERGIR